MNLPIPEVNVNNLVFFAKHMKLRDDKTAVHLDAESKLAKIVWNQMMNIYRINAFKMGTDDKKALNEVVASERRAWLAEQGVSKKGLIIFVGGQPCWRIDQDKIGLRKGFYDDVVQRVQDASSKQKLGAIKRQMKKLQSEYLPTATNFKEFHIEHISRVKAAYDAKFSTL